MATIFLTPDEGVYRAPDLPPAWLWSYSLEFDDVFYVNEPTGSTQWEWPADDVSSQRFWFWLSEQYKVDEHGHAISCTTAGGDVPQDRALHGFGRPQKTSTSTSGVTFRQKLSNFFVGDFHYRPPPGRPPASNVKPGIHPWRPWKEHVGETVGAEVQNPPLVTPFPYTPSTTSLNSHNVQGPTLYHQHQGASLSPRPSISSTYDSHNTAQGAASYQQPQGASLSPRPSISSTYDSHGYHSEQSHQSHQSNQSYLTAQSYHSAQSYQSAQSSVPSFASGSSASSQWPVTPASSAPTHANQQWSQPPPYSPTATPTQTSYTPPMPTQTAFTPPSYPSPPLGTPHQKPAYNTADSFKPSAAHANFHGQMPNTINAGAFKPRPREMGDEDFGPDGAAAGYFQQPYQDAAYAQAQQAAQPNQWGTAG